MATICATATTHPPYRYEQDEISRSLTLWLPEDDPRFSLARRVFANAAVETRYGCRPLYDLVQPLSLSDTSRLYRTFTCQLGTEVTRTCLARAQVDAAAVDLIITTSCTGLMIPSLDAYLANTLSMSPHVKRLPLTELGCAAGAAALARAFDYLQAFPLQTVLVVAVELPSLTFQVRDLSTANIVSSALFGDGAAAVLLQGSPRAGRPRIVATQSVLFPDTTELMGFDLRESGLHIILSAAIPTVVCTAIPHLVSRFLGSHGLTAREVRHFLLHPGGRRVLDGIADCLHLTPQQTQVSRTILRHYGNLSSAAVLFVLDRFLAVEEPQAGDWGLLVAFGPGFSAELLLLRWE
ncbi:MAG: type III polyketide synthase [Candidatus Binatia bacterium]|nr:type III polyketide synthase [Candidatus Binatia bacterium]